MSESRVRQTFKANMSQAAASMTAAAAATTKLAEQLVASLLKSAKPYMLPFGWRCSRECGKPIQFGDLCVTTSDGFKPWERAHAACLMPRKGTDSDDRLTIDDDVYRVVDGLEAAAE